MKATVSLLTPVRMVVFVRMCRKGELGAPLMGN